MKNDNEYLDKIGTVLITEEEIIARAKEIGAQIVKDYAGKDVVLVCILRGAVMWMTELMKHINMDITIDFMACSSYGASTKSSGIVKVNKDLSTDIEGKSVIIVEDIVDRGVTLNYLVEHLSHRNPESIKICTLLDKPAGRVSDIKTEYNGFILEDSKFIVGYGLDFDQKYRNLPYISYLNEDNLD